MVTINLKDTRPLKYRNITDVIVPTPTQLNELNPNTTNTIQNKEKKGGGFENFTNKLKKITLDDSKTYNNNDKNVQKNMSNFITFTI